MSKRIGIIAEDRSDVDVVEDILTKYASPNTFSIKRFVGNGCGKLRQKCGAWTEYLFKNGCEHVFIFHDLDENDFPTLENLLRKKVPPDRYPNSLIVIPVEELEAWLLSDSAAIAKVFNLKQIPKKITDCDAVSRPKEHLRDIAWKEKKRYLNTVHNIKISKHVSLANLKRCRSFRSFDEYISARIF